MSGVQGRCKFLKNLQVGKNLYSKNCRAAIYQAFLADRASFCKNQGFEARNGKPLSFLCKPSARDSKIFHWKISREKILRIAFYKFPSSSPKTFHFVQFLNKIDLSIYLSIHFSVCFGWVVSGFLTSALSHAGFLRISGSLPVKTLLA